MLELRPYQADDFTDLLDYELTEAALQFTRTPLEAVAYSVGRSNYHPFWIMAEQKPVGFFVLDSGDDKMIYTSEKASLLLRALSIDTRYLRRGYGQKAMTMIKELVLTHFPKVNLIVLGVNAENKAAISLYQKIAFKDTGRQHMGPKGPQLIMEMTLNNL